MTSYTPAYFGKGTKLTVLDPNIPVTSPMVKVLKPSKRECQDRRDKRNQKTLVCVASGFYPDHVKVTWQIDGRNVTDNVSTDGAAQRDGNGKYYAISSRLRIPLRDWNNLDMNFTCIVSFFNGDSTVYTSDWLHGTHGHARVTYLHTTQSAKLSYVVLIFKSGCNLSSGIQSRVSFPR